ncbi:MAG: hypothetical protein AAGH79_11090 [Bacteroidota bacterium]
MPQDSIEKELNPTAMHIFVGETKHLALFFKWDLYLQMPTLLAEFLYGWLQSSNPVKIIEDTSSCVIIFSSDEMPADIIQTQANHALQQYQKRQRLKRLLGQTTLDIKFKVLPYSHLDYEVTIEDEKMKMRLFYNPNKK